MTNKILKSLLLLGAAGTLSLAAPALAQEAPMAEERVIETASPDYWGDWGIDLTAMDTSTRPGDDFFRFVSGTWFD